jgi:hypothetical protein
MTSRVWVPARPKTTLEGSGMSPTKVKPVKKARKNAKKLAKRAEKLAKVAAKRGPKKIKKKKS